MPKGSNRKKTGDSEDETTYKLVDWGGITYKFFTTPQSMEMDKLAIVKSRRRRKTQSMLHDLMKKKEVMKTKTIDTKRVTWDPEITSTSIVSVSTQFSYPSPDSEPVLEMDPTLGSGQASTNVFDRRPKNRNKVAIRWARKMNNRRLAKIAKKRTDDSWASLTDKCLQSTTTAPVLAVAESLPPSSY